MTKILSRTELAPNVVSLWVEAPRIARKRSAGQFVVLRAREGGERFPLTIADASVELGAIRLVFQVVGRSTSLLAELAEGEEILDLAGPLGRPTDVERYGSVVMVAGGIGVAPSYPIAQAMRAHGNHVVAIVGARTAGLFVMLEEMRSVCHAVHLVTEDRSEGRRGRVTDLLAPLLEGARPDRVITIGPTRMMQAVSELTRHAGVPTVASLNPVMVDGTGMCGGCRVLIHGKTKFVCVDGPEFDAHAVDFENLIARIGAYRSEEQISLATESCRLGASQPVDR